MVKRLNLTWNKSPILNYDSSQIKNFQTYTPNKNICENKLLENLRPLKIKFLIYIILTYQDVLSVSISQC